MPYSLPDATTVFPVTFPDRDPHPGCVYLKNVIDHPRIEIGDFTYAADFESPKAEDWVSRMVPYMHPGSKDRLIIGKFCQFAHGVRFITANANHRFSGPSSYPFPSFDHEMRPTYSVDTRDMLIGHDVWIGYGAIICPGAQIGNGVIVGAGAVVRGRVPDYAIVTGNSAQITRMRFSETDVARMNALAWWDWPVAAINAAAHALEHGDIDTLERFAP